jgi:hypothetical protein
MSHGVPFGAIKLMHINKPKQVVRLFFASWRSIEI